MYSNAFVASTEVDDVVEYNVRHSYMYLQVHVLVSPLDLGHELGMGGDDASARRGYPNKYRLEGDEEIRGTVHPPAGSEARSHTFYRRPRADHTRTEASARLAELSR